MPRISQLSTEVAGSTSDVIASVGSTTRRLQVQQLLGAQFTAQGQLPFAAAADESTFLAVPTSGAVLTYSSGSSAPVWSLVTSGGILTGAAAGTPTWLAPPTSGAILTYSSGSSIPSWSIPTSGAVLVASSVGVPVWRAIGTGGHVL